MTGWKLEEGGLEREKRGEGGGQERKAKDALRERTFNWVKLASPQEWLKAASSCLSLCTDVCPFRSAKTASTQEVRRWH